MRKNLGVMRYAVTVFAVTLIAFAMPSYALVPTVDEPIAVLRALDKITARVEELNVPAGEPYKFGTLIISVRACRVTPPEETPEAAAFLEISELKPGEEDAPVFHGWMFASSPALSAMQHPVYDIWVTGCKGAPAQSTTGPTPAATATPDATMPAAATSATPDASVAPPAKAAPASNPVVKKSAAPTKP